MTTPVTVKDTKITIVLSEFNLPVTENLLKGAEDAFAESGGNKELLKVFRVPGAFEIPAVIHQVLKHQQQEAVIALGAVIRGDTPHFDYISGESARGLAELGLEAHIPVINGIITTNNARQAYERSRLDKKNKGREAMLAALQTIAVYRDIQKPA
jgi:6,7-dimethyl-8-ribityllumazine synthase